MNIIICIIFNFRFSLPENEQIRDIIAKGQNRNDFRNAIMQLKEKYLSYHLGQLFWNNNEKGKIFSFHIMNFIFIYIGNLFIFIFFRL